MAAWTALVMVGEMHNTLVFKARRALINHDKSNDRILHSYLENRSVYIQRHRKISKACVV